MEAIKAHHGNTGEIMMMIRLSIYLVSSEETESCSFVRHLRILIPDSGPDCTLYKHVKI